MLNSFQSFDLRVDSDNLSFGNSRSGTSCCLLSISFLTDFSSFFVPDEHTKLSNRLYLFGCFSTKGDSHSKFGWLFSFSPSESLGIVDVSRKMLFTFLVRTMRFFTSINNPSGNINSDYIFIV